MPPVGFEPTISAGVRPQTYALDRSATGNGIRVRLWLQNKMQEISVMGNTLGGKAPILGFWGDSSVGIRLAKGWTVRESKPGEGEIFRTRPDRPWLPRSLLYNG